MCDPVNVNVKGIPAISEQDFDNSRCPGQQAKGANHLETPLRQVHVPHRASSCARRVGHVQLLSKPRGAREFEFDTFRRRSHLLPRPPTASSDRSGPGRPDLPTYSVDVARKRGERQHFYISMFLPCWKLLPASADHACLVRELFASQCWEPALCPQSANGGCPGTWLRSGRGCVHRRQDYTISAPQDRAGTGGPHCLVSLLQVEEEQTHLPMWSYPPYRFGGRRPAQPARRVIAAIRDAGC